MTECPPIPPSRGHIIMISEPGPPAATMLMPRVSELEYELAEAESEIARHHRDFQSIRDILDEMPPVYEMARRIRNVVG